MVYDGCDRMIDKNVNVKSKINIDDNSKVACGSTDVAVEGMEYFDKYNKYNGTYATKVIKVQ